MKILKLNLTIKSLNLKEFYTLGITMYQDTRFYRITLGLIFIELDIGISNLKK